MYWLGISSWHDLAAEDKGKVGGQEDTVTDILGVELALEGDMVIDKPSGCVDLDNL